MVDVLVAVGHVCTMGLPCVAGAVQDLVVLLVAVLDLPGVAAFVWWVDGFGWMRRGVQRNQPSGPQLEYDLAQRQTASLRASAAFAGLEDSGHESLQRNWL